jgi:hypothetical protein
MLWAILILTYTASGELATGITVPSGSLARCESELQAVQERFPHATVRCDLVPSRLIGRPYVNVEAINREKRNEAKRKEGEAKRKENEAKWKEEAAKLKREEEAAPRAKQ